MKGLLLVIIGLVGLAFVFPPIIFFYMICVGAYYAEKA